MISLRDTCDDSVTDELFPLISSFMFQLCKSFAVQCDFEIICEILFFSDIYSYPVHLQWRKPFGLRSGTPGDMNEMMNTK